MPGIWTLNSGSLDSGRLDSGRLDSLMHLQLIYVGPVKSAKNCYNDSNLLQYNWNSLARQELGLNCNFSLREKQIIGSGIIQTNDKVFPKKRYILDILTKMH